MSKAPEYKYRNHYKCSECGHEWQDEWDCKCNDRCPKCNAEIESFHSEDINVRYRITKDIFKGTEFYGHEVTIDGERRIWNDETVGNSYPPSTVKG